MQSDKKSNILKNHPLLREILSYAFIAAAAFALTMFIRAYIITIAYVPSESMEPTIKAESRILVNKMYYHFYEPQRGDVIVFPFPDDESELFIKRVMGLPGETIEGKGGHVYINGKLFENDYSDAYIFEDFGPFTVPDDCYFMMGDNRNNSKDSRYWHNTYVKKEDIIGKAIYR